jgi:hypothetical protein
VKSLAADLALEELSSVFAFIYRRGRQPAGRAPERLAELLEKRLAALMAQLASANEEIDRG